MDQSQLEAIMTAADGIWNGDRYQLTHCLGCTFVSSLINRNSTTLDRIASNVSVRACHVGRSRLTCQHVILVISARLFLAWWMSSGMVLVGMELVPDFWSLFRLKGEA
ncbi:hypothetical protein AMTR_s00013p00148860 [Amborella trichopoda]|uniref:Uncharacterized protein n=1 Tax=Amborella trichopoda TaxID=13333 RepID=W1PRL2_AMBTC|nr:hypothetical protein AMTR_s00013p00148860 [Amborella trichopoda]